jgi:uncharacterized protein YciI
MRKENHMHFIVIAHDDPKEGTLERRMRVRAEHLNGVRTLAAEGHIIDGGVVLDAQDRTVGSVFLCDFPDRSALDAYLKSDVYAREKVWKDITVLKLGRINRDALLAPTGSS